MNPSGQSAACLSCAAPLPGNGRFCGQCGVARSEDQATVERHHHATVVVSDLQGSTALAERLDPESLRLVLDQYFDELGRVLESHGGRIEKRIGDAMVTVFGLPVAKPDDALRAARAVAESQATLEILNRRFERVWNVRLTNRTGVSSGVVIITDAGAGHRVLAGPTLEQAMLLEPAAPPQEALLSVETVAELSDEVSVESLAPYRTRNGSEIFGHRLLAASSTDAGADAAHDTTRRDNDAPHCLACGSAIPADSSASWCVECGSRVVHGTYIQSRRTLTILFADIRIVRVDAPDTGSHAGDPPPANADSQELANRHALVLCFDAVRAVLERHGGIVEKYIGDAVMAVFGLDQRREDDALRTVRAALEMQTTISALNRVETAGRGFALEARIGVNTGPVIAGDPALGQRLVTGDSVNVAARLEQAAGKGDVLIGALTKRLCDDAIRAEDLEPLPLKGKAQPVAASRVLALGPARRNHLRPHTPMIGRDAELATLLAFFEAAEHGTGLYRAHVTGEAGSGKSRLVHELNDLLDERANVVSTACLPYGEGITFWPVLELIGELSGVDSDDDHDEAIRKVDAVTGDAAVTARLASLMGLVSEPFPLAEIFWAVRRLVETISVAKPFVLVVDGLHWAEPTFVELLAELQQSVLEGRSLLVTMARFEDTEADVTELDDEPADEPEGEPDTDRNEIPPESTGALSDDATRFTQIELGPLNETEVGQLLHASLSGAPPDAVLQQVVRVAGGNPLFVEQIAIMLIEDSQIQRGDGDTWVMTRATEQLDVPPTVEALLAARIDALNAEERATLAPASIIGREFPQTAVMALAMNMDRATIVRALMDLGRRRLVQAARTPDELADHRFSSLLVRDVVYIGILKRTRAEWHEGFAQWLENAVGTRVTEFAEVIGYHFEQSFLYLGQLGMDSDAMVQLGNKAFHYLAPSGERAFVRGDMRAASSLLERAARLLPTHDRERNRTLIRAGEARMQTGAFAEALAHFEDAAAAAQSVNDEVTSAAAQLASGTVRYQTGDNFDDAAALELVERLQPTFEAANDHASSARCWRLLAYTRLTNSQWGAAELALTQLLEHARLADDTVLALRVLPGLVGFALHGPTPVIDAIAKGRELRRATSPDRRASALTDRYLGHLLALNDEGDEGRLLCSSARTTLVELGWNFEAALVSIDLGPIELMMDKPAEAEAALRVDFETLKAMGEQNYLSTTATFLAEAVRRQGRLDEALELAAFSAGLVAPGDTLTQAFWREVRAAALVALGAVAEAEGLAREALQMVLQTDALAKHGDANITLAEVLLAGGRQEESLAAAHAGLDCYLKKGHRPGVRRAQLLIDSMQGSAT